jgi:cytochrome c biogenesis protein CcdA
VFHLLAVVVVIAIVDSANPSTIGPALYLAAGRDASRSLAGFIAGVFIVNLAGGLIILVGPGQALVALVPRPGAETRHLVELALGLGLLVVATVLWLVRQRMAGRLKRNQGRIDRSSFLLGALIMAVELPTAVPYFAAITALAASGERFSTQAGLLVLFNALFVAPLVAILAIRLLAGPPGQRALARLRDRLDRQLARLIPGLVGLAGVALVILGTVGVVTD